MNERIKELIKSLGIIPEDEHYEVAELIVREFCQKLENDGMVEVAIEMKQHFGVKQ